MPPRAVSRWTNREDVQLPGLLGCLRPQAPAPAPSVPWRILGLGRHVRHHVEHLHGFPARVFLERSLLMVLQVICFVAHPQTRRANLAHWHF